MSVLQASLLSWTVLACGLACGAAVDPPARVGRLSHVDGEVLLQLAGVKALEPALINWPLTSGDRIVTEDDARAEIGFGTVSIRLDSGTDLSLLEVDRSPVRLALESGALNVTVRDLRGAETVELKTPRGTVRLLRTGEYHVKVSGDGAVLTGVRRGQARVETSVSAFQQLGGEQASIATDGTVTLDRVHGTEEFDRWSQRRERRFGGSRTAPHVARGLVGYEDLDVYGDWHWERDFGMVWEPKKVPRDWAPYRHGQWVLKKPWGWTWIDEAPWGFAPFHYGRWVELRERWFWLPGPRALPPVYAPALVRWVEHPKDPGLIGWRPLRPYEDFVSPYLASKRHIDALNVFAKPGNAGTVMEPQSYAVTWMARSVFQDRATMFRQRMAQVEVDR